MTASVSTRGMKGAAFSDAARERMYLETLGHYLETLPADRPIVFAENSGWPLDTFKEVAEGRRVEFVSVDPAICDQSRGKGYNEILMMNDAIARSAAIREAGAFMKVTGRYPIYNLPRLLKDAEAFLSGGGSFYGDMKDHKVFDVLFPHNTVKWNGHALGTAVFAATVDFYRRELSRSYEQCNDYTNDWIEVVWYRIMGKYRRMKNSGVRLRFPVEAAYGGWQGSDVKTLACSQNNDSVKARFSRLVGNGVRTFMPWFWW